MAKQRMSFRDAMDLVHDDLPDGAYWAMAHEMAGLEYGDGFYELVGDDGPTRRPSAFPAKVKKLTKKGHTVENFDAHHHRINGWLDWWPSTDKWKEVRGPLKGNGFDALLKTLKARKEAGAQP